VRIIETTGTIHVGAGQQFGEVTWFPLWTEAESPVRFALATSLRFEECAYPQVERLTVTNDSQAPGLLIQGETLRGGRQDRTSTTTVLVPPMTQLEVPVACIEQGRWAADGGFERTAVTSSSLRARHATARVRSTSATAWETDQPGTWTEIDRLRGDAVHLAPTGSYHDVREGRLPRLQPADRPHRPLAGQRGVALGYGGRIRSIDLFGTGENLSAVWAHLLDAARFEASFAPVVRVPAERARRAVRGLARLRFRCTPALGLGVDLRAESEGLVANGLRYLDGLAHLAAYTREPAGAP
jgi:hypothetical protein